MRQEEGSDNDEEADMLMALAEQAGPTPKSQTQRSSQQVILLMRLVLVHPCTSLRLVQCIGTSHIIGTVCNPNITWTVTQGIACGVKETHSMLACFAKATHTCIRFQTPSSLHPGLLVLARVASAAHLQWASLKKVQGSNSRQCQLACAGSVTKTAAAAYEPFVTLTARDRGHPAVL